LPGTNPIRHVPSTPSGRERFRVGERVEVAAARKARPPEDHENQEARGLEIKDEMKRKQLLSRK